MDTVKLLINAEMSNSFVFKKSGFENNNKLKTSKDWGDIIRYVYVFKKTVL